MTNEDGNGRAAKLHHFDDGSLLRKMPHARWSRRKFVLWGRLQMGWKAGFDTVDARAYDSTVPASLAKSLPSQTEFLSLHA